MITVKTSGRRSALPIHGRRITIYMLKTIAQAKDRLLTANKKLILLMLKQLADLTRLFF